MSKIMEAFMFSCTFFFFQTLTSSHSSSLILPDPILQVSFPGEPDPTNLGKFLKRMLFLLSKPLAAAAILGVEFPPAEFLVKQRAKNQAGRGSGQKATRKLSVALSTASEKATAAANIPQPAEHTVKRETKDIVAGIPFGTIPMPV